MDYIAWIIEHWYLFFGIFIVWIYFKYSNKQTVSNFSLDEMFLIAEYGFYIFVIYYIESKLFTENNWFSISIPIFMIIWSIAINYILSKDDVYLLETALMGEEFNDMLNGKKVMSLSTRLRLLIMDREYYNSKQHIGDTNNPLLNVSRTIKFTDYYDDKTGIIYHSEYPELNNINFFTQIATWLKMKKDVPQLIKENITHTWLQDYKLADLLNKMKDNFVLKLLGISEQYEDKPFTLTLSLDEQLKEVQKMKQYSNERNDKEKDSNIENNNAENTTEA